MTAEIPFEKALERLEKIVEDLETGNISLEEALKKYEEGVKLSRSCQEKLAQAEKKIEVLTKTLSGSLKKEPFEYEEAEKETGGASSLKRKKSPKSLPKEEENKNPQDEDLLF